MSILYIAEVKVKNDQIANIKSFMKQITPDTRGFKGNEGVEIYFDMEENDLMFLVEKWNSEEDYHKYHQWRVSTGVIDKLRSMLAGKPKRRFLKRIDA